MLVRGRRISVEKFEIGKKSRRGICESCGSYGHVEDEWEDQGLCKTCGDISLLGYANALRRGVFVVGET